MKSIVFVLCSFYDYNHVNVEAVVSSREEAEKWKEENQDHFYEEFVVDG